MDDGWLQVNPTEHPEWTWIRNKKRIIKPQWQWLWKSTKKDSCMLKWEKRTMQILLNIAVTVSLWLVYKELNRLVEFDCLALMFAKVLHHFCIIYCRFSKLIWCNFFSKQSLSRRNCSWIRGRILDMKSCDKFMVTYCFTCMAAFLDSLGYKISAVLKTCSNPPLNRMPKIHSFKFVPLYSC